MQISKEESLVIDGLRFVAVLSIAAAHTVSSNFATSLTVNNFGIGGVALFFIISGYLFNGDISVKALAKNSMQRLILPTWFTGSLLYCYFTIRHGELGLLSWVSWNFGYKTYLWYMTVLIILYIIFYTLKRNKYLYMFTPPSCYG